MSWEGGEWVRGRGGKEGISGNRYTRGGYMRDDGGCDGGAASRVFGGGSRMVVARRDEEYVGTALDRDRDGPDRRRCRSLRRDADRIE